MDAQQKELIEKMASGMKTGGTVSTRGKMASLVDDILLDLVKGGKDNHRTGNVDVHRNGHETKMSSVSPLELAKLAGAARAVLDANFTVKEAGAYIGFSEAEVTHLLNTVR